MKKTAIILSSFLAAAAICRAQAPSPTPSPTPPIHDTATPIATVTPAKTTATGTPHVETGASSPTPNPASPTPVAIDTAFQPPMGDPQYGTVIEWREFKPLTGTAWPVVIVLHSGGFKTGSYYQGNGPAPQDLAAAGFLALVADYTAKPHQWAAAA